jgi:hypothetical protein
MEMTQQIILTADQTRVYHASTQPVAICDSEGKVLGTLLPAYSAEFIAELKRRARAGGKRFSSEQVTRHLQALAEIWNRDGPFDGERVLAVLKSIRAENAE